MPAEPVADPIDSVDPIVQNINTVAQDRADQIGGQRQGRPSLFVCSDCGGVLWQVDEPELVQFRCHVGHVLSGEALLQAQIAAAENALWMSIRSLNDVVVLARQLAAKSRQMGDASGAADFETQALAAQQQAQVLQQNAHGAQGAPAPQSAQQSALPEAVG